MCAYIFEVISKGQNDTYFQHKKKVSFHSCFSLLFPGQSWPSFCLWMAFHCLEFHKNGITQCVLFISRSSLQHFTLKTRCKVFNCVIFYVIKHYTWEILFVLCIIYYYYITYYILLYYILCIINAKSKKCPSTFKQRCSYLFMCMCVPC